MAGLLTFLFVRVPTAYRSWQWRRLRARMPKPVSRSWIQERKQQRALQGLTED